MDSHKKLFKQNIQVVGRTDELFFPFKCCHLNSDATKVRE